MALQRLDGVDHANVNLVTGKAEVFPKRGKSFDPTLIPKAIKDAGFSATGVEVTADGTFVRREGLMELNVPGLKHPFTLTGGPQAQTLARRSDLVGKEIHVTGQLESAHGNSPPGLTVESFRAAS